MQATTPICFCTRHRVNVRDVDNNTIFKIERKKNDCCPYLCFKNQFEVNNLNGDNVGDISRKFGGLAREILTDGESACFAQLLSVTDLMFLNLTFWGLFYALWLQRIHSPLNLMN